MGFNFLSVNKTFPGSGFPGLAAVYSEWSDGWHDDLQDHDGSDQLFGDAAHEYLTHKNYNGTNYHTIRFYSLLMKIYCRRLSKIEVSEFGICLPKFVSSWGIYLPIE